MKKQKNNQKLKRGNPEYWNLNGQAFYSTNMTWKQRSTIVNYYHSILLYVNKQIKDPFPTFLAYTLNMDVVI
jgi:hypothetical protein